jgi:hypothetical protein
MKRYAPLIIIFILGFLTYWFVFREQKIEYDKKEANFTIKDTNRITAIFLADKQGNAVKLSKQNGSWVLNDSFRVRQDAISYLLNALYLQRAEMPVPVISHDNVVKDLAAYSVKTEIYQGDKRTHVFYVGKNPAPGNLTYMLTEGARRPFIVRVPIQNLFLGIRYMTRPSDWRDRRVLYALPNEIQMIDIAYKDSIRHNFTMVIQDTNVNISGNFPIDYAPDKRRVTTYLSTFSDLYCTGFEDIYAGKDFIIARGKQIATLTLHCKDGREERAIFYYKPMHQGTKKVLQIGKEQYDGDNYFAFINNRDFVVFSSQNTKRVLRSFIDFFPVTR